MEAQQAGSISGTVIDAASLRPIADARVSVAGTSLLAFSDGQGRYALSDVPVGEIEVRLERIGYAPAARTLLVATGQSVTADFNLLVSAVAMDALVVTATGLQRRRELGNAAASIQVDDELERAAPATLTGLLQGRAAGVQVLQSSGTVGNFLDHQDTRETAPSARVTHR